MSSTEEPHSAIEDEDFKFVAPAQRNLNEILEADKDDPSLQKYKEKLLGEATNVIIDPSIKERVIVKSITLLFEDTKVKPLKQELPPSSQFTLRVKEDEKYKIQFEFYVQREIVCGLKYVHKVSRKMIPVAKEAFMIGSYPPAKDLITYVTPWETAPSGMLARGSYKVHSKIMDDDSHLYADFTWTLEIASSW